MDKAIFELMHTNLGDIFKTFWSERHHGTTEAHSLESIVTYPAAEMGGGCFAPQTPILMADHSTKPIQDVQTGDYILTRKSADSPQLVSALVADTLQHQVSGYLILNQHLKVTPEHLLWVNGQWNEAGNIQINDLLTTTTGESVEINSIEWIKGDFTVYNLEIADQHTYFADGIWVHNQKGNGSRTIFKDTAYWNPSVQTDLQGRAQVRFTLPDDLTTWVIAGVGSTSSTQVGQTTEEILVTQDVIVRPVLPNLIRVHDQLVLSAQIQNSTLIDREFDIDLFFNAGTVQQATHSAVPIKSNSTHQVYWPVTATQEHDQAQLTFSAISRDTEKVSDRVTKTVPVIPFGFWERTAEVGNTPRDYQITLNPDSHQEKSTVTLTLAPTLIGTLPSSMKYLVNYPYGCVEQTTSRFVPAVIAKAHPDLFADAIADKDIDDIIQTGVDRLKQHQLAGGGWTWWHAGSADHFITAYVFEYLVEAQKLGADVDQQMLDNAIKFLENLQPPQSDESTQLQANIRDQFVIQTYALSLINSNKITGQLTDFQNITPDILSLAVIANAKNGFTNPNTNGLAQLIAMAKHQGDTAYWTTGNLDRFGSQDTSTALAIRAILAANGPRQITAQAVRHLINSRRFDYWSNTFATAQVIRALVEFGQTGDELDPNYHYTVSLDGKAYQSGQITDSTQSVEIDFPIKDLQANNFNLSLSQTGIGQIYSTLVVEDYRTNQSVAALNHGLDISRKYIGEGVDNSIGVGDLVTVELTVSGLNTQERYGIISDQLPAGLIPINKHLKNQQFQNSPNDLYNYSYGQEVTLNGVDMSLYRVNAGSQTYRYQARAIIEGQFLVPPVQTSLMYLPEVYGRSGAETVTVIDESTKPTPAPATPTPSPTIETEKKSNPNTVPMAIGFTSLLLGIAGILYLKKLLLK